MQRLDSALLGSIGVLLVHQIAYTASAMLGYQSSITHGHMALAWFGGSLAALVALARAITRSLKRRNHALSSVRTLGSWIAGGYVLLEQFERAIDGYGTFSLFAEPVFWLGLAVALPVAAALSWSARSVVQFVSGLIERPAATWPAVPLVPFPTLSFVSPGVVQLASVVSRRGPPARLFI